MKFKIRDWLPAFVKTRLFGDREKWGLNIIPDDPCWQEWQHIYTQFYSQTQREGIGEKVNDAGYKVMASIDLTGKRVLEIGAGDIRHLKYLKGMPSEYVLADVRESMMVYAQTKLGQHGIPASTLLVDRNQPLPLDDRSIDVVISFYSLEHLHPLRPYLDDIHRVLKPGGTLLGAIPAEGGVGWGLGRMLTSRRWFKRNTKIDPDKIICWEHPNFADSIIDELDTLFINKNLAYWPLSWPALLDCNLVVRFRYQRSEC